ncbi:exonuclease domain-containing protein [Streptomyces sp. NPDC051546]|uniref:3'-5' exonuclease n=1 Tax=Streptomyces sp. NPDC051546 TaxID=3365655 RepID=UPI00378AF8EC
MSVEGVEDPAVWADLFTRDVDGRAVRFVRPADTDRPTWSVYDGEAYLGTVSADANGGSPLWRVQSTREAHRELSDTVRALRRPTSWPRKREEVTRWARRLLADDSLLAVDVETTGLQSPYAVQIAAVDRHGTVVFNEYVQPDAAMEAAALQVHGITPERLGPHLQPTTAARPHRSTPRPEPGRVQNGL